MKITIDATGLSRHKTGTVTYLVEILAQWNSDRTIAHDFVVFCTIQTRHHFDDLQLDKRFLLSIVPVRKLIQMMWQQTLLPLFLLRHKVDVHWGPGFVLPLLGVCPMVVTIHDMTFDLFPESHEPIKRLYFPFMIRRAVKRANKVLVDSESTANDLDRLIPGSAEKTVVAHLAARTLSVKRVSPNLDVHSPSQENPTSGPYVLFIGTLEPRKNLYRLLQAWKQLSVDARFEYRLIVVGVKGWMVEQLEQQGNDNVEFVGHVPDHHLQAYLRGASCFVYPSLYEGFGLPVIEAMAAGIPVLTSNVGATREIARDAAVLVDPMSAKGIEDGLRKLLTDPNLRQQMSEAGIKRAGEFSWEVTSKLTLDNLTEAASANR